MTFDTLPSTGTQGFGVSIGITPGGPGDNMPLGVTPGGPGGMTPGGADGMTPGGAPTFGGSRFNNGGHEMIGQNGQLIDVVESLDFIHRDPSGVSELQSSNDRDTEVRRSTVMNQLGIPQSQNKRKNQMRAQTVQAGVDFYAPLPQKSSHAPNRVLKLPDSTDSSY